MSNLSEPWSVDDRRYQAEYQTQGEPLRGSNDSELSQELGQPTGFASGQASLPYNGATVPEDKPPPVKRPRKMMIRYFFATSTFVYVVSSRFSHSSPPKLTWHV